MQPKSAKAKRQPTWPMIKRIVAMGAISCPCGGDVAAVPYRLFEIGWTGMYLQCTQCARRTGIMSPDRHTRLIDLWNARDTFEETYL